MAIKFKCSRRDRALISDIVARAHREVILLEHGYRQSEVDDTNSTAMDIVACHCNGTPLDLEKLASADGFTFAHDVTGIRNCLNRRTGKLENCFLPRCAQKEKVSA